MGRRRPWSRSNNRSYFLNKPYGHLGRRGRCIAPLKFSQGSNPVETSCPGSIGPNLDAPAFAHAAVLSSSSASITSASLPVTPPIVCKKNGQPSRARRDEAANGGGGQTASVWLVTFDAGMKSRKGLRKLSIRFSETISIPMELTVAPEPILKNCSCRYILCKLGSPNRMFSASSRK